MKRLNPLGRRDNIVIQELKDEVLIYDFLANKALCLNKSSAMVWELCNGDFSITQISKELSRKINSNISEEFVWLAIDQLRKENLIDDRIEIPNDISKQSRRELIKNIGMGTIAVLPVISALVAPTSAQAASCSTYGQSCTTSSSCCSASSTVTFPGGGSVTFTGGCCRNGGGPYGANNTCVPGPSSGFTVPCGTASHNGATVGCPTTGNVVCR